MARHRKAKADAQHVHARRRALERYGVDLDDVEGPILKVIQQGRSTLIERQSLRVSVHDVTIATVRYRVVYDRKRGQIATFLAPDMDPVSLRALYA